MPTRKRKKITPVILLEIPNKHSASPERIIEN
jgi:hypothetical protein